MTKGNIFIYTHPRADEIGIESTELLPDDQESKNTNADANS